MPYTFFTGTKPGKIITDPRYVGFEIEAEHGNWGAAADHLVGDEFDVGSDGSLNDGGIEVRTAPASLNELERIVLTSTEAVKDAGFSVTANCGLHIHLDARDIQKDYDKVSQVWRTVYALESLIHGLIPLARRSNHYCESIRWRYRYDMFPPEALTVEQAVKEKKLYYALHEFGHYSGVNMYNLTSRGTIEFRYHPGTLNPTKMLYWAAFLQSLLSYAVTEFDPQWIDYMANSAPDVRKVEYGFFKEGMSKLTMSDDVRDWLMKRFAFLNKDLVEATLITTAPELPPALVVTPSVPVKDEGSAITDPNLV